MENKDLKSGEKEKDGFKKPDDPLRETIIVDARPYYKNKGEKENEAIIIN